MDAVSVKRPFDLVILDLDGTILDLYHANAVSPVVREAISAVQAMGVPVTIGTGRVLDYVRLHAGPLGITTPVITTQGAVIGDPVTGRVWAEEDIPLAEARRVALWLDEVQPIAVFYFVQAEGRTAILQNRRGPDPHFEDHVFGGERTLCGRFQDVLTDPDARPPIKFIAINDPASEADLVPDLKARFEPALTITRTHPMLVEGTARGVDKGAAVQRLCRMLEVDPKRVLAIGDSDNDIPMLEAVGFAVAMGNASEGVKAVADWVAPSIEEEGAAVALQHWVLDAAGR